MNRIFKYNLALFALISSFAMNMQADPVNFLFTKNNKRITLDIDLNSTVGQTKAILAKEEGITPERIEIIHQGKKLPDDTLWGPIKPSSFNAFHVAINPEEAPKALGTQVSNEVADRARTNTNREFKADNRVVIKHRGQNLLAKVLPANSVDPDVQELVINGILIPVQIGPDASDIRTVSPDEIVGKLS